MKIAIACHPTHGGSGVVAAELGMQLAQRGHIVHFVSYQAPFRVENMHENIYIHEVEVSSYPLFKYPPYALALANKLVEVVKTHGVELLHVHYAIPHSISAVLTKQMCGDRDLKVVTTLHGTDITLVGNDSSFYEITKFGIENSDAVTAVSEYLAQETFRQFEVNCPIEVIPNFVDVEYYHPNKRRECLRKRYAQGDEFLMSHVSNFRPVKRVADVIKVFAKVHEALANSRLVLIGSGPDTGMAEQLIEKLYLQDKVSFTGSVSSVADILACSDVFLLPSEYESFGLAALEAMACGVPVVASNAGGLAEVVDHGKSGFLHPVGDVDSMAASAIQLLEELSTVDQQTTYCGDAFVQSHFGIEARRSVSEHYPEQQIVSYYERCYERVLGLGPRGECCSQHEKDTKD